MVKMAPQSYQCRHFLVDRSGMIRLAFIDEDYTKRLDPEEILEALRRLSK